MGAIHGDYNAIGPKRKASVRFGDGIHARMALHEIGLFFRPAKIQGAEQIGIGFGDPAEVFRPVTGTDDDIAKHGERSFPCRINIF